jgi:hypothetical protein
VGKPAVKVSAAAGKAEVDDEKPEKVEISYASVRRKSKKDITRWQPASP